MRLTSGFGRAVAKAVAGSVLSVSAAKGFRAATENGGGDAGSATSHHRTVSGSLLPLSAPRLPFFLFGASTDHVNSSSSSPVLPSPGGKVQHLKERFRPGDYYVWLYRDKEGNPTSWERYEVVPSTPSSASCSSSPSNVIIEMQTKFVETDPYVTHHRMIVDLERHLDSYGTGRDGWRIGFEYVDPATGEWRKFGPGDNVQAFEEKFDVFSMLGLAGRDNCIGRANDNGDVEGPGELTARVVGLEGHELTLTRTDRHRYTGSWYGPTWHRLSGVAILKDFAEHTFALIQAGRDGKETDFSVNF